MTAMHIIVDGDDAWTDLKEKIEAADPSTIQAMGSGTVWSLLLLKGGMRSGAPSIGLRLDLPDGRVVIAETSWALLELAAKAFQARISG